MTPPHFVCVWIEKSLDSESPTVGGLGVGGCIFLILVLVFFFDPPAALRALLSLFVRHADGGV